MTTKDHSSFFKDKQHHDAADNLNGEFKNLNLNQNNKCFAETIQSKNFENHNKKNSNYDNSHNIDQQTRQNFTLIEKTKLSLSLANPNIQNDYGKKEGSKEEKNLNTNNSTLSIHITAYENSIEATSGDTIKGENEESKKKNGNTSSIKNWKTVKEIFNGSSVKYAFELPRQQQPQNNDPEVMQFLASQRVVNPNELISSSSNQQLSSSGTDDVITLDEDSKKAKKTEVNYNHQQISDWVKRKTANIELKDVKCCKGKYSGRAVYVKENEKFVQTDFVQCIVCTKIVKNNGGQLKRHFDDCNSLKRPAKESIGTFMIGALSSSESQQITDAVGRYALEAGLSFYRCGADPMYRFVTDIFNIGAKHQRQITMNNLHFDRKSIKNSAMATSSKRIDKFKPTLREAAEKGEICFALDHGQRFHDYLSIVAHLLIEEETGLKMVARPIGFVRVKPDEKNADCVYSQFEKVCEQMGINKFHIRYCNSISDEGSTMIKALKDNFFTDNRCICHLLCTVVLHLFQPYTKTTLNAAQLREIKSAYELFSSCKTIVSLARSSKTFILTPMPRQFVKTRFMSCLWVFEDLLGCFDKIIEYSHDTRSFTTDQANAISFVAASKRKILFFIEILKPIEEAITKFEGENYATFHLVANFWTKLHIRADELRQKIDPFEKAIGSALKEALKRKQKYISRYHLAACILYPPTRRMLKFSEEQRMTAESALKDICDMCEPLPPLEKERSATFDDMDDADALQEQSFEADLLQYRTSAPDRLGEKEQLLDWWFKNKQQYPRLYLAAKKLLGIPASSTSPERSFSHSKLLITDQRCNMNAETVSGLMLVGYY